MSSTWDLKATQFYKLGQFNQQSTSMVVTDPSYEDLILGVIHNNVRPGVWHAFLKRFLYLDKQLNIRDQRNAGLYIFHDSVYTYNYGAPDQTKIDAMLAQLRYEDDGDVSVDTGQAGFYDLKFFNQDNSVKLMPVHPFDVGNNKESRFYAANMYATEIGLEANVLPYGVVSRSGWGDGSYIASFYTQRKTNDVVAATLEFIADHEEDCVNSDEEDENNGVDTEDDEMDVEDDDDEENEVYNRNSKSTQNNRTPSSRRGRAVPVSSSTSRAKRSTAAKKAGARSSRR